MQVNLCMCKCPHTKKEVTAGAEGRDLMKPSDFQKEKKASTEFDFIAP